MGVIVSMCPCESDTTVDEEGKRTTSNRRGGLRKKKDAAAAKNGNGNGGGRGTPTTHSSTANHNGDAGRGEGIRQYVVVGAQGATVRQDEEVSSAVVTTLPKDSLVDIAQIRGRRAELVSPVTGWASISTVQNYLIMEPLDATDDGDSF